MLNSLYFLSWYFVCSCANLFGHTFYSCVLNAFVALPFIRFSSHSNYAALIRFSKVETFQQPFQFSAHISNIETIFHINCAYFRCRMIRVCQSIALYLSFIHPVLPIILIHTAILILILCTLWMLRCHYCSRIESNRQHTHTHTHQTQLCILAYIFYLI